jgi:hypothetical protein
MSIVTDVEQGTEEITNEVSNTETSNENESNLELNMDEWLKENSEEAVKKVFQSQEGEEDEVIVQEPEKDFEEEPVKPETKVVEDKKGDDELIPSKRYRDLQSHADKTISAKDREIAELKALLESKKAKEEAIVPNPLEADIEEPTDEEFDFAPKLAAKKLFAYLNVVQQKKLEEQEKRTFAENSQKEYVTKRNDSFKQAFAEFPDFADPTSEFSKLVDKLADEDAELAGISTAPLKLAREAARQLKIKSALEKEENKPTKIKKDTSYIMKQGGSKDYNNNNKELTDDEFLNLPSDKQEEYMKRQFFGT